MTVNVPGLGGWSGDPLWSYVDLTLHGGLGHFRATKES